MLFVGVSKAVSDLASTRDEWINSVFAKLDDAGAPTNHESYWGYKEMSWKRKHTKKGFLGYLLKTLWVFFSDIWHTANTVRHVAWLVACIACFTASSGWLLLILLTNRMWFHLFYMYILVRAKKRKANWESFKSIFKKNES
jgi:hypothetical protein